MVTKFDSLNRHEPLTITLCNPGSTYSSENDAPSNVVGILVDTSDEELCLNFNQISELNFRVTHVRRENPDDNEYVYMLYKAIQPRRLVYVSNIGYFMLSGVDEGYDEDGRQYKDISAQSIEAEIQNRTVPYIADGTYRFSSDIVGDVKGLLDTLVTSIPLWTIGEVDDAVAAKYRTFEDVDTKLNILSFMLENMQDAYECIFIFDIANRTINVYDQNDYVRQTDIHITKDDLIKSIDISENSDDLYTAISVMGDDNITISAINPLGGNTIYNFSNYLSWMSDGLGEKVAAWQEAIEANKSTYYDTNLQYFTKLETASNFQAELQKLEIQIEMYTRCRENIVAEASTDSVAAYNEVITENGGTAITIYEEIQQTLEAIDNLINTCKAEQANVNADLEEVNAELETLSAAIESIHNNLSMDSYFTESEYAELSNYVYEGSYSDEYVIITDSMTYSERFEQMKTLYDRAELRLQKVSMPTQEFKIDVENFIFAKEFEQWSEQLETGCLINVELESDDVASLFLSNITVNYDDHTLSMTFGNRFNRFDPKSLFENMLGDISKAANTLDYVKDIIYPIKNGQLGAFQEQLNTSRTLTANQALASENQEITIDSMGYTGRKVLDDGSFSPEQLKINNNTIVFTDNAWETCKTALGKLILDNDTTAYGINAEIVIGNMIIGGGLKITDEDGKDLLTVVDDKITMSVSDVKQDIENVSEQGGQLQDSYTKFEQEVTNILQMDADGTTMIFQNINQAISDVQNEVNDNADELERYIRFTIEGIELGDINSPVSLLISHDRISFRRNEAEVAYMADSKLYITDAEFLRSIIVGALTIVPRDNGNISFKKNQ